MFIISTDRSSGSLKKGSIRVNGTITKGGGAV